MVFLGIPSTSLIIALFARTEKWWEYSSLAWVWSVFIFMITYGIVVVYCDAVSYFRLIQIYYKRSRNSSDDKEDANVRKLNIVNLVLKGIYLRQRIAWSGIIHFKRS